MVRKAERIRKLLIPLVQKTFLLTLPSKAELLSDQIMNVIDRMNDRYAKALRLDAAAMRAGHNALVEEVFSSART